MIEPGFSTTGVIIPQMWECCKLFTELCNAYEQYSFNLYVMDKIKNSNHPRSKTNMEPGDLEKSKSHIIVEIIEYVPNSVVMKTIIKKSTGNISVMSFDSGEGLTEKTSPFDTYAQIIEGRADIVIDKVSHLLESGQGIVIPANLPNFIKPNGRFKMILTIIKSLYD